MKILLTGKNGQVGWELNRSLLPLGQVIALDRQAADFSQPESLRNLIRETKPDVIVNAAAYTAVDRAEDEEELAIAVNAKSPGVLAEEAKRLDALLVHYSTDYVFDGAIQGAYVEQDAPSPLNVYGRSKLTGEQAIQASGCDYLIFRTSWVYAARGKNFLLTVFNLAKEREKLSIVGDQFGSPTWAGLIAGATSHCVRQAYVERKNRDFESGLFHLASSGYTTWHGFAEGIVKCAREQFDGQAWIKKIDSIPTSDYPTLAKRPKNSRLNSQLLEKRFRLHMPNWEYSLSLCMEDLSEFRK